MVQTSLPFKLSKFRLGYVLLPENLSLVLLGNSPSSWKSMKQGTLSKSSATHSIWLARLLEELNVTDLKPVTLHCDNQSTLHIARNSVFHIELECHFTRDKVMEILLPVSYLPTMIQLAWPRFYPLISTSTLCTIGNAWFQPFSNLRGGIGAPSSGFSNASYSTTL